jgi:hypothetical protein
MKRLFCPVLALATLSLLFWSQGIRGQTGTVTGYDASIIIGNAYVYHVALTGPGDVYVRRCHLSSGPSWSIPARCIGNFWGSVQQEAINQFWLLDYNSHLYLFVRAGDSHFYFRSFYDDEVNRITWIEGCTFLGDFWDGAVSTKASSWGTVKGQFKN